MDRVWTQLMRVDAKVAASLIVTASVIAACIAVLRLGFAPSHEPVPGVARIPAGAETEQTPAPTFAPPVMADAMPATPFVSEYLAKRLAIEARERAERERAAAAAPPPDEPAPPEPPPPEPEPTPPRILRFVYQGSLLRPDHTRIAIIEERTAGTIMSVRRGEAIDVYHVDGFGSRFLTLAAEGRDPVNLPINQEIAIEVPQP